jgi:formylglycine-generating enzyme required for sulfatase activity
MDAMRAAAALDARVAIPGGRYLFHATHRFREGGFILFDEGPREVQMQPFQIDRYEVTNAQFRSFLDASGYRPAVMHNFLRHWRDGFPAAQADHPVTWVSLEDARVYAAWAGKRLPTDMEWQWAAQGPDGRAWPWGAQFDPAQCNSDAPGTTPVSAYPANVSPFGVCDLVGNVWEWIDGELSDGWHRWCFVRGGSYYQAKGSMWYVEGGAQPVYHHTKFLLMYPGLDRCATVGFRCVTSVTATAIGRWA